MTPETVILPNGQQVVLIHFLDKGKIACMPHLKDMAANLQRAAPHIRTDAIEGVTCPLCKKVVYANAN